MGWWGTENLGQGSSGRGGKGARLTDPLGLYGGAIGGSEFDWSGDPYGSAGSAWERIADPFDIFNRPPGVDWEFEKWQPDPQFAQALHNAALGRGGPSAAQQQLQQGLGQATRRGQAVAASQRGVSPALAARMGSQMAAGASMDANRYAAILRAQEQMQARGQYMGMQQMMAGQTSAMNQLRLQKALKEQESAQQGMGGMMSAAGGLIGGILSDRRAKKDIEPAGREIQEFLSSIQPLAYHYKDPDARGAGPGQRFGIVAQDAQKTPVGQSIVVETPEGDLALDQAAAVSVLLATVALLNKRIEDLESGQYFVRPMFKD